MYHMTDQTQAQVSENTKTIEGQGKLAERVEQFIKCREKRRALKKAFTDEDKPLAEMESLLSASIQKRLTELGAENVRTSHGTCFLTHRTTASLADPDAFMQYVIQNGMFELLDRKANATAVKDYVKKNGQLPPGANLSTIQTIGVHKKVGSAPDTDD
jgi:hypothetical protein